MSKLRMPRLVFMIGVLCAATAMVSPAQTFTSLVSFDGTNGLNPYTSLVQGTDGNLYGTTTRGGAHNHGSVFKTTPSGTLTTLYSFCSRTNCTDGATPGAGLLLGVEGNFYGTTFSGGESNYGTVFKITPGGALTTLYSFCSQTNCTDGATPHAGLNQATDGNFYGTTYAGGINGWGTIFEITTGGALTVLYSFCAQSECTDGIFPYSGLVQAGNGSLYGTTFAGGIVGCLSSYGCGTVFKMTGSSLTTLYTFDSTDGFSPSAGLIQATDGNFYGTTEGGHGTVFKITAGGTLTTLHSFDVTDGAKPFASLVQATDGNFYGTTIGGGANNYGTVFKITSGGALTTAYNLCSQTNCTDGATLHAGLVQATNGNFYGTTDQGGTYNGGTVFSLAVGLGPFVETLPTSGKVGARFIILGTNLTGTTSVRLKGTPAAFTIVSSTEIITTVPTGATTGTVEVTTPSGTLKSNVAFRVP